MSKPIIFVAGSTGNIGCQTLKYLDKNKFCVKAGTRNLSKGEHLKQKGFEVVQIDYDKKETLVNAFKGVDRLLVIPPNSQTRGKQALTAIQVAKEVGVKFVVLFSVVGASEEKRNKFQKEFAECEEFLKSSGLRWTILQAPYFQENLLGMKEFVKLPLRDGALPSASTDDLGKCCAKVLENPEPHVGKTYILTGPKLETGDEIAMALSSAYEKQIKYTDIPREESKKQFLGLGMPQWQVDGVLELLEDYASRRYKVTNHIQTIIGAPPKTFEQTVKASVAGQAH